MKDPLDSGTQEMFEGNTPVTPITPEDAEEKRKRLQRERTAKYRAKINASGNIETSESRERREDQERIDETYRLREERNQDIIFELGGYGLEEFGPNTPEEDAELQTKVNDFLVPHESLPFEQLYAFLSASEVGRAVLHHFDIEPLGAGWCINSTGIHKLITGKMVECTDGSWTYTTDFETPPKSAATIQSEVKMYSPQIREMQIHNLKIKLEKTRIKAIEDRRTHETWLRGLEKQYLSARKAKMNLI